MSDNDSDLVNVLTLVTHERQVRDRGYHRLGLPVIDVNDARAIVEVPMTIEMRGTFRGSHVEPVDGGAGLHRRGRSLRRRPARRTHRAVRRRPRLGRPATLIRPVTPRNSISRPTESEQCGKFIVELTAIPQGAEQSEVDARWAAENLRIKELTANVLGTPPLQPCLDVKATALRPHHNAPGQA